MTEIVIIKVGETLEIRTEKVRLSKKHKVTTNPPGFENLANKLLPRPGRVKVENQEGQKVEFQNTMYRPGDERGSFAYMRIK